jgi:hypothetical protein
VTLGSTLGTGQEGTVFDIPAGFDGQPAVAKEFNIAINGITEIGNLKKVGQFIAQAPQNDAQKTLFAIIKKEPGQKLVGSPNFPPFDQAKAFGTCPAFMEQIRERIAEAVVKNATTGIVHAYICLRVFSSVVADCVHSDFANKGNVLLSGTDATGFDIAVNLVDWGQATLKGSQTDAEIVSIMYMFPMLIIDALVNPTDTIGDQWANNSYQPA